MAYDGGISSVLNNKLTYKFKVGKYLDIIYSKFICKKFYFAERARRGNSGRKLIESYGGANTILYDHGGTTLDK